jgi:hypothetical protein
MFWGCFTYDKKGPCHIWEDETDKEKRQAKIWLNKENEVLELQKKQEWELETAMRRVHITRNARGRKPQWKFTKATGKLVRDGKGGIDWYRYQKEILHAKLLPFAKERLLERPGTIVQEDNAAPHAHYYQSQVYNFWQILKLLWPSNSPDLNAIECAWAWMKRRTTEIGVATSTKQLKEDWIDCWEELPQDLIQKWIERIPIHIQEVIRLGGGNEYKEGRNGRVRNPQRVH